MMISTLSNIGKLQPLDISRKISKHSHAMLENSLRGITYNFKMLYENPKFQENPNLQKILKKTDILSFGKTPEEGITILGEDVNHKIQVYENNHIQLSFLNKETGETERIFKFKDKSVIEAAENAKYSDEPEEILEETLDFDEFKLLKLRRELTPPAPKPYIPTKAEIDKLNDIKKTLVSSKMMKPIKNYGTLKENDMEAVQTIRENVGEIKELFEKFSCDNSRRHIRSYYDNYVSIESNRKTLTFKDIGPMGEKISISVFHNRGKKYVGIKTKDISNNKDLTFIISEQGTVQRNQPWVFVYDDANIKKRKHTVPDYYTQEELDNTSLGSYLICANNELEKYKAHAQKWLKKQADFKETHTNENAGTMSSFTKILNDVSDSMSEFRLKMKQNCPHMEDIETYEKENNIKRTHKGILFKSITPEGDDLRITKALIRGVDATQILLMKNGEIKDTFFVMNEKLVRYKAKSFKESLPHADRQVYYYPQEYIDNTRFGEYVNLIQNRLNELNNNFEK